MKVNEEVKTYLAKLTLEDRKALMSVRAILIEAIPGVEETLTYGIPVYRFKGKGLVSISAGKNHLSLHLMSPPLAAKLKPDLKKHKLSGATLHFTAENPLSQTLVKKIVRARISEVESKFFSDKKEGSNRNTKSVTAASRKSKLLSGDNPQIPKGYGDGHVQSYLNAVPGWKQGVCYWIDKNISEVLPSVKKAIKWNSPFYGVKEDSWFLSFHCFTKYVKVTFFRGDSLSPQPPEKSKQADVRYWNLREEEHLDNVKFKKWLKQAIKLPGVKL